MKNFGNKVSKVIFFSICQQGFPLFDLIEIIKRDCRGYAIGGLSGGEDKDHFWRMVTLSTEFLPKDKPRYLMGVGYDSCSFFNQRETLI